MDPQSRQFSEGEAAFLQSVAHVLAAAVERDRSERGNAALDAFGRFALESRDVSATIAPAVDVAMEVLDTEMGLVTRLSR